MQFDLYYQYVGRDSCTTVGNIAMRGKKVKTSMLLWEIFENINVHIKKKKKKSFRVVPVVEIFQQISFITITKLLAYMNCH